jgi:septal ring factor EnvC (AmiA/AmiB activator)
MLHADNPAKRYAPAKRHAPAMLTGLALVLALVLLLVPDLANAQSAQGGLDAINSEIKTREQRAAELKAQADTVQAERKRLQKRIIALAANLREIDVERTRLEERLGDLALAESQLDARLQADRAALSRTLAGLQAMQVQPPPAFAVHPDDALAAVQGALVMTSIVPTMQMRADDLSDRLTELSAIRRRIDMQSAALVAAEEEAKSARAELDVVLAGKAEAEKALRARAEKEARAIARLVREARSLRELSQKLAERRRRNAPPESRSGFASARGLLPLPVNGEIILGFGGDSGTGAQQQGMTIAARAGAQITAPYDGRILYAGPFRQYGSIIILSFDTSYQMILAGMDKTRAYVGQQVLTGEPVGELPIANGLVSTDLDTRQQLYMELRYDGSPIDPSPWLRDISG